ncbi:competence protein CoiA family protein [Coleofasciculus sp. G2-EDA-02]|uniref:competence protein CoiA family protein n=1 Tax=Coleofasciculus sp. G2-EDA-02 TaxID=3069529 RepID=UPI0032F9A848
MFVGTCGINELYKEDKRLKDNSLGVKYEFVIKLETGKKRIIDVASFLPDGSMEAHEVQLCAITPEELEERTVDYENASISVVWWFGKSANTQSNRDWYYHRFGEVPPIFSFNESRSQSDLNISVDYSGQNLPITLNTLPQNWYWFDFYFASKTRKNSWFKEGGLEDQDVELGYQDILKEFLGAKEKARNRLNNFPSTDELSKVFSLVPGSPVEFVHLSKRIGILKKEFIPDKKSGKWIEQCYEYNIDSIPSVIEESQIEEPVRKIKLSVALLLTGQFMGFVPSHPHYFCRQIPSVRVARCLEVWGKLTFPKLEKGLRMEPKSLSGCLGSLVNKQVVKKKENLWCFISIDPLGIPPLGNPHVIKARARAFQQFFDKERSRKI